MPNQLGQLGDRGTVKAFQTRFSLSPDYSLNLSPEIAGVIPLEMPELLLPMGWRRWQTARNIAAVAAQFGRFQIRCVDTGTYLLVVESVTISSPTTCEITADFGYGPGQADLTTPLSAWEPRDTRQRPAATDAAAVVSQETNVASVSGLALDMLIPANTPYNVPGAPWVLLPGGAMLFGSVLANTALLYTIVWRARLLQEQENTP